MNFVVALQAEACPVIDHYGLKGALAAFALSKTRTIGW